MDSLYKILNILEDLNLKDGKYLEICGEIKVVSDIIIKNNNSINTTLIDDFKSSIYLYQCEIEQNNRYINNLRFRTNSIIHTFKQHEHKRNIEKYHLLNTISMLNIKNSKISLESKELIKVNLLGFTMHKLKMLISMDDVELPKGYSTLRKNELVLLIIDHIPNINFKIKNYNLSIATSISQH